MAETAQDPNRVTVPLAHPVKLGEGGEAYTSVTFTFPLEARHYREVYVADPREQPMAVLVDLLAATSDMPRAAFLRIKNSDLQNIFEATAPFVDGAV